METVLLLVLVEEVEVEKKDLEALRQRRRHRIIEETEKRNT